ncbi:MAG: hypothetical protein NTV94_00650 [Planctomycetota bacterium]|nr:hypothetical protein [Planctomycetota bacterium]
MNTTPRPTLSPRAWLRWGGFVLGVLLLAAAVHAITRDRASLDATLTSIRSASPLLISLLIVLPIVNWLLTSFIFWLLMHPSADENYVAPGIGEMLELIGAAWLANYLPVRPGLFGRIAWHRKHGGVPIARSIHSIVSAIGCGVVAVVLLVGAAWATPRETAHGNLWAIAALIAPPLGLAALAGPAGRVRPQWRWFLAACSVRCIDVWVWMARYWVAFAITGQTTLELREAAAIAAVSQAASMIPLAGNGLGLRETAVGMMGAWLPTWYVSGTRLSSQVGLASDIVNRTGELFAAIGVGTICGLLLVRRMNAARGMNAGDRT